MKLTGNTLEDFEKWYINSYDSVMTVDAFDNLPESYKWGVYVDYFDSKDIYIEICKAPTKDYYYWMVNDGDEENGYKTRPEARESAIEKANEIYNTSL